MIAVSELQSAVNEASRWVALPSSTRAELIDAITTSFIKHRTDLDGEALLDTVFESEEVTASLAEADIDDIDYDLSESSVDVRFDKDIEWKGLNPDKVVDGEMCILGRVASHVAEQAKSGTKIAVVNAEGLVVTGSQDEVLDNYRKKVEVGSDSGPRYPKVPDRLVKRTIRGMLAMNKTRGRESFGRIRVYIDTPPVYDGDCFVLEDAKVTLNPYKNKDFVRVGEISKHLGATPHWE